MPMTVVAMEIMALLMVQPSLLIGLEKQIVLTSLMELAII
jgi:hypothetical protein